MCEQVCGGWLSYIINLVPRKFDLSFPIYVLLDLEMLSASIEIIYSVQVVLRVRFAERRNFPFSTSKAGLRHKNRWYVKLDLSLLMKHWTVPSRDPGCFSETGKVSFPDNSGLLTISLHILLHDRQTAAHATTFFRAGHVLSLSSNLLITSYSSSGGRLAQRQF